MKGIFAREEERKKKRGEMMKNPKKLTLKQKKFLEAEGLDPTEYLITSAPIDCYKFYHIRVKKKLL